jgi:hypothetical protein
MNAIIRNSRLEEMAANHSLETLMSTIPDSTFSKLTANPAQTKDACEYLRKAEEILLKNGLKDINNFFILKKDKEICEEHKEAGNIFHKSENLHLSLEYYNKW